jgi:hypothetical protein
MDRDRVDIWAKKEGCDVMVGVLGWMMDGRLFLKVVLFLAVDDWRQKWTKTDRIL